MGQVQALCRACGQKKPVDGFVMSHEAQKMVCAECAKSLKKAQGKTTTPSKETKSYSRKEYVPDEEDHLLDQMIRRREKQVKKPGSYRCSRCNYVFSPNSGKVYTKCPFCKTSLTDKV